MLTRACSLPELLSLYPVTPEETCVFIPLVNYMKGLWNLPRFPAELSTFSAYSRGLLVAG